MTNEQKIAQLENQLKASQNVINALSNKLSTLTANQDLLLMLFRNSSPTRLALHNQITTDAESMLGVFGAQPVSQAAAIIDVTGGATVDTNCRTAVNALLSMLRTYGFIKP